MTQDHPDVVVIGDLVTDVVVSLREPLAIGSDAAAEIHTTGGGGGANLAAWLARSGVPVAFAGRVGDDDSGRIRVQELQAAGVAVHVAVDSAAPTGSVVVLVTPDGERTMLPDRGANANLSPDDLDPVLDHAGRHLHLSGYTLFSEPSRAAALDALRRAREVGMTVSVDPASAAPLRSVGTELFLRWTDGVDLCMPNADEAAALTGLTDPEPAARRLAEHYGQVVVSLGGNGALWTDGERAVHSPAAAGEVIDTTGAGDAFAAGFLAGFVEGEPPDQSLCRGHEMAAVAVALRGARPAAARP